MTTHSLQIPAEGPSGMDNHQHLVHSPNSSPHMAPQSNVQALPPPPRDGSGTQNQLATDGGVKVATACSSRTGAADSQQQLYAIQAMHILSQLSRSASHTPTSASPSVSQQAQIKLNATPPALQIRVDDMAPDLSQHPDAAMSATALTSPIKKRKTHNKQTANAEQKVVNREKRSDSDATAASSVNSLNLAHVSLADTEMSDYSLSTAANAYSPISSSTSSPTLHLQPLQQQQFQQHSKSAMAAIGGIELPNQPATSNAVEGSAFHTVQPGIERTQPSSALPSQRILRKTKLGIVDLFKQCNPAYTWTPTTNPRRILTDPAERTAASNYTDNAACNLVLAVNDILSAEDADQQPILTDPITGLPEHRYRVADLLGEGTFGIVVKCEDLSQRGKYVAVKVVKNKLAYTQQAISEIKILTTLNQKQPATDDSHSHILQLYHHFVYKSHICLVFELLSVNLYELIKQNHFRGLSLNLIRTFLRQLLESCQLLRQLGIVHADLKPENVLLQTPDYPKIRLIDFGSACLEQQPVYSYIQSRFYRSPEVLLGLSYGCPIDMWSLGCIACELFLGLPVAPGVSQHNQLDRIISLIGLPPEHMLAKGKLTKKYFNVNTADHSPHGTRYTPPARYSFKSAQQVAHETGSAPVVNKVYFHGTTLAEAINLYPIRKNYTAEQRAVEVTERECFIHFVRGMLEWDPQKRITPYMALHHPFVTRQPLSTFDLVEFESLRHDAVNLQQPPEALVQSDHEQFQKLTSLKVAKGIVKKLMAAKQAAANAKAFITHNPITALSTTFAKPLLPTPAIASSTVPTLPTTAFTVTDPAKAMLQQSYQQLQTLQMPVQCQQSTPQPPMQAHSRSQHSSPQQRFQVPMQRQRSVETYNVYNTATMPPSSTALLVPNNMAARAVSGGAIRQQPQHLMTPPMSYLQSPAAPIMLSSGNMPVSPLITSGTQYLLDQRLNLSAAANLADVTSVPTTPNMISALPTSTAVSNPAQHQFNWQLQQAPANRGGPAMTTLYLQQAPQRSFQALADANLASMPGNSKTSSNTSSPATIYQSLRHQGVLPINYSSQPNHLAIAIPNQYAYAPTSSTETEESNSSALQSDVTAYRDQLVKQQQAEVDATLNRWNPFASPSYMQQQQYMLSTPPQHHKYFGGPPMTPMALSQQQFVSSPHQTPTMPMYSPNRAQPNLSYQYVPPPPSVAVPSQPLHQQTQPILAGNSVTAPLLPTPSSATQQ